MHHVRVGLHGHQLVDLDAAVLAHPARGRCARGPRASRARRAPSRRRAAPRARSRSSSAVPARGRVPAIGRCSARRPVDLHERLGRGAGDLEVLEVEEVHVRARVDRAQAAVDRERLDRAVGAPALARHHLVDVARADVLLGALHRGARSRRRPRFDSNSRRLARRRRARAARARPAARARRRSPPRLARSARSRSSPANTLASTVTSWRRWSKASSTSETISARSGMPSVVGVGARRRSARRAHEVVAEQPHRAAGERRQPVQRGDPVAAELLGHERVGVAVGALLAVHREPPPSTGSPRAGESRGTTSARSAGPARPTRAGTTARRRAA